MDWEENLAPRRLRRGTSHTKQALQRTSAGIRGIPVWLAPASVSQIAGQLKSRLPTCPAASAPAHRRTSCMASRSSTSRPSTWAVRSLSRTLPRYEARKVVAPARAAPPTSCPPLLSPSRARAQPPSSQARARRRAGRRLAERRRGRKNRAASRRRPAAAERSAPPSRLASPHAVEKARAVAAAEALVGGASARRGPTNS